ncbi:MAG: DUF4905 domain-containing protein [Melioribacteraceae bacterium]|nr:DUF4905 domain-containing protein [Melioribacteraceae bacterium]
MKLKKHIRHKDSKQIWRILISKSDTIIIESRDTENKEVLFNCYDLPSSKRIIRDHQFEEKFWIGIEDTLDTTIFFHKFVKPDMPGHQGIIAFSIINGSILWENPDLTFLFILNEKIYCYKQMFEARDFYSLNSRTGEIIESLGRDVEVINDFKYMADEEKDYSDYIFPERIKYGSFDGSTQELLKKDTNNCSVTGDFEFVLKNNIIFINFHHNVAGNLLENKFLVYDIAKGKKLYEQILNSSIKSIVPDSFFVYKNYLIYLKDKREVHVLKLL